MATAVTEVVTAAVSCASWAVSVAILLMTVPVVVEIVIRRTDGSHLAIPLLAIAGMLGLLAYTVLRPGTRSRVVFLVVGALLAGVYQVSLLSADPALIDNATYILNRLAFVLVLVSLDHLKQEELLVPNDERVNRREDRRLRQVVISVREVGKRASVVKELRAARRYVQGLRWQIRIFCCAETRVLGSGGSSDHLRQFQRAPRSPLT